MSARRTCFGLVVLLVLGPSTLAMVQGAPPIAPGNDEKADASFYSRLEPHRARLALQHGGSRESEAAVAGALQWFANHQFDDGGWSFDHYATQVAFHWEGDVWETWNDQMHDWLVGAQVREGHEAGSWFFPEGDHGAPRGGRHYTTSLAAMMLQVYYRHPPIYRKRPPAR